jgi:hypothetical protein
MKKIEEEWKTIEGFPKYEISNFGRCRNKEKKNALKKHVKKQKSHGREYTMIQYGIYTIPQNPDEKTKRRYISAGILVARAFIENPNGYKQIEYIDSDPTNALFTNIRWINGRSPEVIQCNKCNKKYFEKEDQLKKIRKKNRIYDQL